MTDIVSKIKALMAKAESTEFEDEANAYYAKAETLIVKYAVDESLLAPEQKEKIESVRFESGARSNADRLLWQAVANANGVAPLFWRGSGAFNLAGRRTDIAFVEALVASLTLHRERSLAHAQKPEWEHGKTFNHSFRMSYAGRIAARLVEWKAAAVADAGTGTDLVLFDRDAEVKRFMEEKYGKASSTRVKSRSYAGRSQGESAANSANISGGQRNLAPNRRVLSA